MKTVSAKPDGFEIEFTLPIDKKFAEDGTLVDESFQKNVEVFITEFLWLAEQIVKVTADQS